MVKIVKILMLVIGLVGALSVVGCSAGTSGEEPNPPEVQAPDFSLTGLDGEAVSLSSFQGRPVMLNFWATWCGPCRAEMPHIQAIYDDPLWRSKGLVILAVNVGETASRAGQFMFANDLSFPVVLDEDENTASFYNIRGIPTTYFIDENGIIKGVKMGMFTSKADIEQALKKSIMGSE